MTGALVLYGDAAFVILGALGIALIGMHMTRDRPGLCECGHLKAAHVHYRPGTDCGACGRRACPKFRPAG